MKRLHRGERTDEFLRLIIKNDPARSLADQELERILDYLSERSKRMVRLRYGLGTGISWTLKEIGQEFGITGQRAREILSKSLRTLREKCDPDSLLNLGLSGRAIASLRRAGIQNIKDLSRRKDSDLLLISGVGMESLEIISSALSVRRNTPISSEMIEIDPEWDVMFLRLSHSSRQCLRSLGIKKIADLIGKTEPEFLSHRSGKGCLREIKILLGIQQLPFFGRLNGKKEFFPRPHYHPINLEAVASRLGVSLDNFLDGLEKGNFKGLPVWRVKKGWKGLICDPEMLEDWLTSRNTESKS